MDINQNIIKIRTSTQMGSGIIYPCETGRKYEYKPLYVIFTNKHLVKDLIYISASSDIKKMVEFDIYDQNGNLVDMELISDIKLFINQDLSNEENEEDLAAFLIVFRAEIKINSEIKLMWNDKNLNTIYIEGFPKVLFDNEVSSKIQLQGKYQKVFPENNKFGVFKITDDYHWYSNYKDLKLFQGFSGGPVYNLDEKTHFIVGLNQSVLNINEGENPFKLLYYYKMKYVLEYLREKGCIIFRRNEDCSVSMRWIYDESKES